MAALFRRTMDYLYLLCVLVGGTALVLISAIIPWAVFTRYVLNSAASWPEPLAILLTIVLTFIGAAAGYRLNLHMNISYFADKLPPAPRRLLDLVVQLLMAVIALFMVIWGVAMPGINNAAHLAGFLAGAAGARLFDLGQAKSLGMQRALSVAVLSGLGLIVVLTRFLGERS